MKLTLNPEFELYERDGKAFCDSLQIAETFGKEHKNVLADIKSLECSLEFSRLNFQPSDYKVRGKLYPRYLLTKDGFTFLVMGYRGKKAARFKEAYINRFNLMESFIKSLVAAKLEFPAFTAAIMDAHEEPKHYHFSNEINMINKIVLGVTAAKFKEQNGVDKKVSSIRPYLTVEQIRSIEELQRVDTGLIVSGMEYEQRKAVLKGYYSRRLIAA
ncbi:MAG: Rha family transcriptional regulator [Lachnospiraceae bacterium]